MDKELNLFREIILAVWDRFRKPWFYPRGQARDIYLDIGSRYNSITKREELELSLPTERRVKAEFLPGKFLYLTPVDRGQVLLPVLRLKCDFGRSIPEIRLRLGLFVRHDLDIRAIGFRFESPEGPGIHNYYHMQIIRGFDLGQHFLPEDYLRWMPDSSPAFPLDVNSSVNLLLSLLISLYGLVETGAILRDAGLDQKAKVHLGSLKCFSIPALEWFWKVSKKGSQVYKFYKTAEDPDTFRNSHKGFKIEGITATHFAAESKRRK